MHIYMINKNNMFKKMHFLFKKKLYIVADANILYEIYS